MNFNNKTNLLVVLALIFINLTIYFNGINNDFIWDDKGIVRDNQALKDINNIGTILTVEDADPFSPGTGYYRPLVGLSYMIDYQTFNGKPYGFRLTNILLHILCSILIYYLILLIVEKWRFAALTALIFSVQAVHAEAVTFISGRSNVMCTLFILLSLYYYIKNSKQSKRSHFIYSMLFLFLGAASKEFAFVTPLIFILYDYSFDADFSIKKHMKKYIAAFSTVFAFLILKSSLISMNSMLAFETESLYRRVITTLTVMVKYFSMQIFPYKLNIYYDIPYNESFFEPAVLFSFLFLVLIAVLIFRYRKKEKLLFFSFFTYFILLIPVSNIIKIRGVLMADRWIYAASFAFSTLLAYLLIRLYDKKKLLASILAVVLILTLSFYLIQRNAVFKDDYSFFSDSVAKKPTSAFSLLNLGNEYMKRGDLNEAERLILLAMKYQPNFYKIYYTLGKIRLEKNDTDEALKYFKKAYELNPNDSYTALRIGEIYLKLSMIDKSINYFERSILTNPNNYDAYFKLAYVYYNQKKYDLALERLEYVLKILPDEISRSRAKDLIIKVKNEMKL